MSAWLHAVRAFADAVLARGRDPYRGTPLFADGISLADGAPVDWICGGARWAVSNPGCQQRLWRVLDGLSALTGEPRWREAALAAIRHHLAHHASPCGLPYWGGHRFVDLRSGEVVGEQPQHELKCTYPHLDLLAAADAAWTRRYVAALWNAHVLDWSVLDMNRHGAYGLPMGRLWDSAWTGSKPFFPGHGLTFINCGSDLIHAALWLARQDGLAGPRMWALRLASCYVAARDPRTGLGAYQFSQPMQLRQPAGDEDTASACGDRARRQLGPELGDEVLEGRVLDPERGRRIHGQAALVQLHASVGMGGDGLALREAQVDGLLAYAAHAIDPDSGWRSALLTDGRPLTPADVRRPGYYRPADFAPAPPCADLLLSYATAWRMSGACGLLAPIRTIARGLGLGDPLAAPAAATACAEPEALLALLELHRASGAPAHLAQARAVAANICRSQRPDGLFATAAGRRARFDDLAPLALLHLAAAEVGRPEAAPAHVGGDGHIHGPHDGLGRTYDRQALWGG